MQVLLVALTTLSAVNVPLAPQVKQEPFVRRITPGVIPQFEQTPVEVVTDQTIVSGHVQLPMPLLGFAAGQSMQLVPAT